MAKRRRGKCSRNARRVFETKIESEKSGTGSPSTMVINRGQVGKYVLELIRDVRKIFEPHTASNIRVRKSNVLKDFVSVAGPLGISHLLAFSKTEVAVNLRVVKLARGPTLTFKVKEYVLAKDVVSALKRPISYQYQFENAPLLIMNNLQAGEPFLKLVQTMFQNMFPGLNINEVNLNDVRRCVLVNYDVETKTFDLRHYTVKMVPVGLSKSMKKLAQSKVPKLGRYKDISEYFLQPGQLSESEAEPMENNEIDLPHDLSTRGCSVDTGKCAVRLIELGPRLKLELLKVEEGVSSGKVLYHSYISKTPDEIASANKSRMKKQKLKLKRRKEQEENVAKKTRLKEEHKQRCLDGMQPGQSLEGEPVDGEGNDEENDFGENAVPQRVGKPKFSFKASAHSSKRSTVKASIDNKILGKLRNSIQSPGVKVSRKRKQPFGS